MSWVSEAAKRAPAEQPSVQHLHLRKGDKNRRYLAFIKMLLQEYITEHCNQLTTQIFMLPVKCKWQHLQHRMTTTRSVMSWIHGAIVAATDHCSNELTDCCYATFHSEWVALNVSLKTQRPLSTLDSTNSQEKILKEQNIYKNKNPNTNKPILVKKNKQSTRKLNLNQHYCSYVHAHTIVVHSTTYNSCDWKSEGEGAFLHNHRLQKIVCLIFMAVIGSNMPTSHCIHSTYCTMCHHGSWHLVVATIAPYVHNAKAPLINNELHRTHSSCIVVNQQR